MKLAWCAERIAIGLATKVREMIYGPRSSGGGGRRELAIAFAICGIHITHHTYKHMFDM